MEQVLISFKQSTAAMLSSTATAHAEVPKGELVVSLHGMVTSSVAQQWSQQSSQQHHSHSIMGAQQCPHKGHKCPFRG